MENFNPHKISKRKELLFNIQIKVVFFSIKAQLILLDIGFLLTRLEFRQS